MFESGLNSLVSTDIYIYPLLRTSQPWRTTKPGLDLNARFESGADRLGWYSNSNTLSAAVLDP